MPSRSRHLLSCVALTSLALGLAACGGPEEAGAGLGQIGTADQAFSEAKCKTATPDYSNQDPGFESRDFVDVSADSYNNPRCFRAKVYRLRDPFINETGVGQPFRSLRASYGASGPFTQAECEGSAVGIQIYSDFGTSRAGALPITWQLIGTIAPAGVWDGGKCLHPIAFMDIPTHAVDGSHPPWLYNVNATARHADNTTASVIVQSGDCGWIGQMACMNFNCHTGTPVGGSFGNVCAAPESLTMTCPTLNAGSNSANGSMTISNTGAWSFSGHVHDGGAWGVNYTFGVGSPTVINGSQFGVVRSGVVHGLLDIGSRDDNFTMAGTDTRLGQNWGAIKFHMPTEPWTCRLHTSTNPWLVAEAALVGLGIAVAGTAAALFIADPNTKCEPAGGRDESGGTWVGVDCHQP